MKMLGSLPKKSTPRPIREALSRSIMPPEIRTACLSGDCYYKLKKQRRAIEDLIYCYPDLYKKDNWIVIRNNLLRRK